MRSSIRESGQVLVEFILVVPIILAIAGGVLEVARFLRFNQAASVFSQEAALTTFRRCSDIFVFDAKGNFDSKTSKERTQTCLDDLRSSIQEPINSRPATSGNGMPTFSLVLSIYRRDNVSKSNGGVTGFNPQTIRVVSPATSELVALQSQYSLNGIGIQRSKEVGLTLTGDQMTAMERVAIAEVAYTYTPVIGLYRVLFGSVNLMRTDGTFRETTIL